MVRFVIFCCTAFWILAVIPGSAASQYAQYYPLPSDYGRPPCQAATKHQRAAGIPRDASAAPCAWLVCRAGGISVPLS